MVGDVTRSPIQGVLYITYIEVEMLQIYIKISSAQRKIGLGMFFQESQISKYHLQT